MAMAMSPRISFSHDVDPSSADGTRPPDDSLLPTSSSDDFGFVISGMQDPSPADELFSQGKLLPLSSVVKPRATHPPPKTAPHRNPRKMQLKDLILPSLSSPIPQSGDGAKPPSSPFWSMGRSISVGASKTTTTSSSSSRSCDFPRSKSMGSYQIPSQNQRRSTCYYYSGSGKRGGGHENGVRINPVINVPAPFIPRGGSGGSSSSSSTNSSGGGGAGGNSSFFAYLLCHCRDKGSKEMEATCSP